MNWKLWLLGLALAGAAVLGWMWLAPPETKPLELTILHTNDVHSHYAAFGEPEQGGAARWATVVDEVRAAEDHVLLLDAGDQFQGTLYFTVGGADVVSDIMNQLGYEAMAIGNHEFDAGPAELARFIELADFPVLSANIDAQADPYLTGKIVPFTLFSFPNSSPVAVMGLTTEHTATASSPGPGVRFHDIVGAARLTVQELHSMGVNKIIALTHLGYERDVELAGSVHGIDVIVGGHSHTNLDPYPTVTTSSSGEPVLIVTAYEWGKQLGRLRVTFTKDGLVDTYDGERILIDDAIVEDPRVVDLLADYQDGIAALMTQIVGGTDVALNGAREDVRARETSLGNLICDAMLWKTAGLGTTIAIQNGGGIRASIPKGMVTMGQVLEVLPYGNQITVLSLTGAQLTAALENGVSQVEDGAGRFPHVAGMRFTFHPSAEAGSRVTAVDVWDDVSSSYVELDPTRIYMLATNGFLAGGGDGFAMFVEAGQLYGVYDTGWLLSDTLAEYLDAHSPVAPAVEGRIVEAAAAPTSP